MKVYKDRYRMIYEIDGWKEYTIRSILVRLKMEMAWDE
jgi:hypothetical protein